MQKGYPVQGGIELRCRFWYTCLKTTTGGRGKKKLITPGRGWEKGGGRRESWTKREQRAGELKGKRQKKENEERKEFFPTVWGERVFLIWLSEGSEAWTKGNRDERGSWKRGKMFFDCPRERWAKGNRDGRRELKRRINRGRWAVRWESWCSNGRSRECNGNHAGAHLKC